MPQVPGNHNLQYMMFLNFLLKPVILTADNKKLD